MSDIERKNHGQPALVRDYDPLTDYLAVKKNLEEGNLYDPDWDSEERLSKRVTDKPDSVIVALVKDEVVGSVFLTDDFYPYINRLAVRQQFRRQGIGEQLLNEAMSRLKKHGHEDIGIFVDEDNSELQEWYKKQNFISSGKYRSMWRKI